MRDRWVWTGTQNVLKGGKMAHVAGVDDPRLDRC
jgi:hypothetical protein